MKTSKLTILGGAILVAAALFAPSVGAQQYGPTTLDITNVVAAASTNSSVGGVIAATKHDVVAVQATFKLQGAGTSAVAFGIYESLDGVTYDDTAVGTLSVTAAGTTQVSGVLPLSIGAVGYLRLGLIGNPNATAVTNLVVKYSLKPKRQG